MSGDGTVTQGLSVSHPVLDTLTEMKSLREIKEKLDALLEAKEDTIRFRKMMVEENSMAWNQFMGAIDGLNAGIARELGELRKEIISSRDAVSGCCAKNAEQLCREIENLHPVLMPLTCGDCGRDFDHCKCKVFAAQNPFPAKPPRKKAAKRKGKRQ